MTKPPPHESPGLPPIDPVPPQSPLGRHPGAARVMLWVGWVLAILGVILMFPGLQIYGIPIAVAGLIILAISRFIA